MKENHIVYIGRLHGVVVYVGEGVQDRYLHLNSGVSHVYEANKSHFAGETIVVEVFKEGLLKSEAREIEKELIDKYNPSWNKTYTQKSMYRTCIKKHINDLTVTSIKLKLLNIAKDTLTDSGEFIATNKQIREHGIKEYPSRFSKNKHDDPMIETFKRISDEAFLVKLRESWLSHLDVNIKELIRKAK